MAHALLEGERRGVMGATGLLEVAGSHVIAGPLRHNDSGHCLLDHSTALSYIAAAK